MTKHNNDRLLEIFFRGLRGEELYLSRLADEYEVSVKRISRSIRDLKAFLADHRDLVNNTELRYNYQKKCYCLHTEDFLSNKELFALVKVMIGSRAFSKIELLELVEKLRHFTTPEDRTMLQTLIQKEMFHYPEVRHDCDSVIDMMWHLMTCISNHREISIEYYRMDRSCKTYRLHPASVMFTDYYFYLIAYKAEIVSDTPQYFRVDRIRRITEHRKGVSTVKRPDFD